MRKLNKRYEKSLKSVRAQKTCPCSGTCSGCNTLSGGKIEVQSQVKKQTPISTAAQQKLWS